MAKATATCKCDTCGTDFIVTKICRNRSDADDFEHYAETHYSECKDCYLKRVRVEQAAKAAPIIAKYGIPDITGVSDKQIAYANNLRNKYLTQREEQTLQGAYEADEIFDKYQDKLQEIADKDFGGDTEKAKNDQLRRLGLLTCYIILRESHADKIIDVLR